MTKGSEVVITGTTDLSSRYVPDHKLRVLDVSAIEEFQHEELLLICPPGALDLSSPRNSKLPRLKTPRVCRRT